MSYIEVKNLSFSYTGKRMILKDISLSIEKGEWVAILGHNGSGKSTLAKAIVGLLEPNQGTIAYDGVVLTNDTAYDIRKKVGIVFQNPDNQFVGVTVRDDIAFGMENLMVPQKQMLEMIDFYSEKVGMKDFLDKEPSTLSGGQKQRVAIAGILAMQTQVIIFDEATSMLDPYARRDLIEYIQKLNQEGITVIMITHDINEAMYANRLVILKEGAIISDGDKWSLFKQPEVFEDSHLELPFSLKLAATLDDSLPEEQAVKDFLWQSISNT